MSGNDNNTHLKTQTATRRLQKTLSHLETSGVAAAVGRPGAIVSSDDAPPRWDHKEHDKSKLHTKWNGWGYADTKFFVNDDGNVELSGNRSMARSLAARHLKHAQLARARPYSTTTSNQPAK